MKSFDLECFFLDALAILCLFSIIYLGIRYGS